MEELNTSLKTVFVTYQCPASVDIGSLRSEKCPTNPTNPTNCTCGLFSTVLLNVSSTCMSGRMQSHTECISLTFLHCAFSNVFSNCLPGKRHIHTGCIYLTFRQSEFLIFMCVLKLPAQEDLNVPPNYLYH